MRPAGTWATVSARSSKRNGKAARDERRPLEAIVSSDSATPGQRLDAIGELDRLRDDEPPFWREVMQIPDEQLDRELDAFLAPIVVSEAARRRLWDAGGRRPQLVDDVRSDEPVRFSLVAEALAEVAERWARLLADADRIDAEGNGGHARSPRVVRISLSRPG